MNAVKLSYPVSYKSSLASIDPHKRVDSSKLHLRSSSSVNKQEEPSTKKVQWQ